jgi:hypothetical protein
MHRQPKKHLHRENMVWKLFLLSRNVFDNCHLRLVTGLRAVPHHLLLLVNPLEIVLRSIYWLSLRLARSCVFSHLAIAIPSGGYVRSHPFTQEENETHREVKKMLRLLDGGIQIWIHHLPSPLHLYLALYNRHASIDHSQDCEFAFENIQFYHRK